MQPLLALAALAAVIVALLAWLGRPSAQRPRTPVRTSRGSATAVRYPGDFTGRPNVQYAPTSGAAPGPGEVVWTWVPYQEDYARGKDRPVLLIGRDEPWLLGLQLSSQDRASTSARHGGSGQLWVDIGSGPWDSRRRPSAVRLDRVVRVDPVHVRREGAVLDRERFNIVAHSLKRL